MSKSKLFLLLLSFLVCFNIVFNNPKADVEVFRQFDTQFNFNPYPSKAGLVNINITIIPNTDIDYITIENIVKDNLICSDLIEKKIDFDNNHELTLDFVFEIPAHEISGFSFVFKSINDKNRISCYFAALDDTILTYVFKPGKSIKQIQEEYDNPTIFRGVPHNIAGREKENKSKAKIERWYIKADGTHIKLDSATRDSIRLANFPPPVSPTPWDTNYSWIQDESGQLVLMKKEDIRKKFYKSSDDKQLERMRELEEQPLTYSDVESIIVDDIIYERTRGEYKFHEKGPVSRMDKRTHHDSRIDSIATELSNKEFYYLLDLRDPKDFEFANQYLDSLITTDFAGIYKSKIELEVKKIFKQNRIRFKTIFDPKKENEIMDQFIFRD